MSEIPDVWEAVAPAPSFVDMSTIQNLASVVSTVWPSVSRRAEAEEVLAITATRDPQAALVISPDGTGRTTFAQSLAALLADPENQGELAKWPVVATRTEAILNFGLSDALAKVLDACAGRAIVYVDDVDVLAALGTLVPDHAVLTVLRGALHNPMHRVVLSISDHFLDRLQAANIEFFTELLHLRLAPMSKLEIDTIAARAADDLSRHHEVNIPRSTILAATEPPMEKDTLSHPGLAVERLDRAAAHAVLRNDGDATADWSQTASSNLIAKVDLEEASRRLKLSVLGQDHAVDAVVERLRVTHAKLDERDYRPNGVFLFAGPTGTGKTELAVRLAEEVYGSTDHLVRLDMSEYSDRWSTTKLIGPGPGYLGSQEPDGWLTTRIRRNPRSVLLLDEIEKADPIIWNTFLQVFDVGRLTDGSGRIADFQDVIVVMTSNIGAAKFEKRDPVGFSQVEGSLETQTLAVSTEVNRIMPVELVNRIDEVIVFYPLSVTAARGIVSSQLRRALERMARAGWIVTSDESVIDYLVARGFDATYGARALQRTIEREVTARILKEERGTIQITVQNEVLLILRCRL